VRLKMGEEKTETKEEKPSEGKKLDIPITGMYVYIDL
jgi:hypothetical protein